MHKQHLLEEEVAEHDANLLIQLDHTDLTETTANTPQTIALFTKGAGRAYKLVKSVLKTPFKDASDVALNTTTLIVGDSGDTDRLLVSQELNENGTEVLLKEGVAALYAPTGDTVTNAIFGSMADKSLSDIDTGLVYLYFKLV
jgi:hypothetical protein